MDNSSQINGNNNIVLQGINGETVTININSLEAIQSYLDEALAKLASKLATLTQAQRELLQKNIDTLTQIANDNFQPLKKDEMEEYAGRLTAKFYGREEERQLIKDFIQQESSGTLFIFGSPGIGKSALMAKTYAELGEALSATAQPIHLIPYFIRRGTESGQPAAFFRYLNESVESVLETQIPIKQDLGALRSSLHQRLRQAQEKLGNQKLVLFIDGLDEGNTEDLLNQLSIEQYPKVLMIFATRYTSEVEKYLFNLRKSNRVVDTTLQGLQRAAITQMITGISAVYPIPTELYPKIIDHSKGNPKYLELLELSLKNGIIDFENSVDVPVFTEGFNNFYDPLVRAYTDNEAGNFVLPILYTLSIAKDYLNSVQLAKITNFQTADTKKAIIILKEVLIEKRDHTNNPYYQLFHESLREYLVAKDYYELLERKYAITRFCRKWEEFDYFMLKEYPAKHYSSHLFELITDEKDKKAKKELYALALNQDFKEIQVDITEQFQPSFSLMEQAIKTTQIYEEPNPALDFALEALNLHQTSQQANQRITDWSIAGGKTNIQSALTAIEGLSVELRSSAYAVLLYDALLGINKNRIDKKEVAGLIVNHLDQYLDASKRECEPFKFWILIVYELWQLEIPYVFFQKRTRFTVAMDSNPLHPQKWSAMQAFVETLDIINPTIFEFILALLEKVLSDDHSDIGGAVSYAYYQHLLFLAQRLAKEEAWSLMNQLEEIIQTQNIQPLQKEQNPALVTARDRGYICLIDLAILQKDFEKASSYVRHIHDFVPAIQNMLKLVELLNELGRAEEARNFLEFIMQEGQPLLQDKYRGINFLCEVAKVLDQVHAPIEIIEQFLNRALQLATSERRVRTSEIRTIAQTLLEISRLPEAAFLQLSHQIVPHFKSSFDPIDIPDLIIRELILQENHQGLTELYEHFSPINYADKLFNQIDYCYQAGDLKTMDWAITYLLPFLDQHIRTNRDKGQLFRFQLKTGALLMRIRLEEGEQLVRDALSLKDKFYNAHILKNTFIYAFPKIYQQGNQELGLQLMEAALAQDFAGDDYNLQQLIKGLIQIGQFEKMTASFEQLITNKESLSTYQSEIILLLLEDGATEIAVNCLQKIARFPEKAKDVYKSFLLDKYQGIVLPIFRDFLAENLEEIATDKPVEEIIDQKDIFANLARGVFAEGKGDTKAALRLSQKASDFRKGEVLCQIAFYYYQQQYDQLLEGFHLIGNNSQYTGIYFNVKQLQWQFIERNGREATEAYEQQYIQADTPIFHDIALDLLAKNQLSAAVKVADATPDFEERERILRHLVLDLLKQGELIIGQKWLIQYLLKSKNIYFWQSLILLLAQKGQLKEALNYLPNFEQSQDSDKDSKRLKLFMELAVLHYKNGQLEQALSLVQQLAKHPKPFHQNERKVAGVSQIINQLATHRKQIQDGADLENWLQTNIVDEKQKTECFYYSAWFLFYFGDYKSAFEMVKYVDQQHDKDFYFLGDFADALTYKGKYDLASRFALQIQEPTDKSRPMELLIKRVAQAKDINKALNLLKTMPDYQEETLIIEKIIEQALLNQLPIVYQFLQNDLKMMPEEMRYKIHRKFLAKVCQYPAEISRWMHKDRLAQLPHLANLKYALFVEQLTAKQQGNQQKVQKIAKILRA